DSRPALLQAVGGRVMPERARIRRSKLGGEARARLDRRLREAGNAIHGDGQPDAVPVNGRIMLELVLHDDADRLALPHADFGARDATPVTPDFRVGVRFADDRPARRPGRGLEFRDAWLRGAA